MRSKELIKLPLFDGLGRLTLPKIINGLLIPLTLLLFVLVAGFNVTAQQPEPAGLPNPFNTYKDNLAKNNYLTPLLELERHENEYMQSKQWKGLFPDLLGYLHSFVGNYDAANVYLDKQMEREDTKDLKSSPLDNYQRRDALETIKSLAGTHQVIMINEEHFSPIHRAFTARLLPVLWAKGFRYLAAETLSEDPAKLSSRGYPVHKTGFYSVDPVFGDMLRTALKLGFKLVSYEHFPNERCVSPADNPDFCQNERERGQAQNLYDRIFKNDPQAKVLVHVGRGHNQKLNLKSWAMMGWHFQQISGIEPFSINQMLSEHSAPRYERPEYRYVTGKWKFNEPIVFQTKAGEFEKSYGYDLQVYHPRTRYEHGRPVWRRMGGAAKAEKINFKKLNLSANNNVFNGNEPLLVQAFVVGENAEAIPVDQIILYPNKEIPVLILPKGHLRISAVNEAGKVIGQYEIKLV